MITKEELKNYARIVNLNLRQAEKDYFQNILLFILYQEYGNELIFKGGTALKKCYGLDRFSEDLDFTYTSEINIKKIEEGLKRFNLDFEIGIKEYENGKRISIRIRGPLYVGIRASLCSLTIDLSYREKVILKPIIKNIGRFLEEIPSFDVFVMNEEEILAEKTRAIMTRNYARDVYDVWFLLSRGVGFNMDLVEKKLNYYKEKWDKKKFISKINEKSKIWETELRFLVGNVPKFKNIKKEILTAIKK